MLPSLSTSQRKFASSPAGDGITFLCGDDGFHLMLWVITLGMVKVGGDGADARQLMSSMLKDCGT